MVATARVAATTRVAATAGMGARVVSGAAAIRPAISTDAATICPTSDANNAVRVAATASAAAGTVRVADELRGVLGQPATTFPAVNAKGVEIAGEAAASERLEQDEPPFVDQMSVESRVRR